MKSINDYKKDINYYLDQGEEMPTKAAADILRQFIKKFYSDRMIKDLVINEGELLCWNVYMTMISQFTANGSMKNEILTDALDHFSEMMMTVITDAHLPNHNEKLRVIRSEIKTNGTYYASLNEKSTNMMIFSNLLYMIRLVHDISDDNILNDLGEYIWNTRSKKYPVQNNIHITVY